MPLSQSSPLYELWCGTSGHVHRKGKVGVRKNVCIDSRMPQTKCRTLEQRSLSETMTYHISSVSVYPIDCADTVHCRCTQLKDGEQHDNTLGCAGAGCKKCWLGSVGSAVQSERYAAKSDMSAPHISIVHSEELDTAPFEELRALLRCEGLDVKLQSAPKAGPFASLEWLIPTAVVLFIAKAYFEAFLAEAGKDHYEILKRGAKSLATRFTGEQAPIAKLVASKGKVQNSAMKYSLVCSVVAELEGSISVKLLLQTDFTPEHTGQALDCFFEFVRTFHSGELDPAMFWAWRALDRSVIFFYWPTILSCSFSRS